MVMLRSQLCGVTPGAAGAATDIAFATQHKCGLGPAGPGSAGDQAKVLARGPIHDRAKGTVGYTTVEGTIAAGRPRRQEAEAAQDLGRDNEAPDCGLATEADFGQVNAWRDLAP